MYLKSPLLLGLLILLFLILLDISNVDLLNALCGIIFIFIRTM